MYVVNSVIPMDSRIKLIINAIAIIAVLLWVLDALGLFHLGSVNAGGRLR